MTKALGDAWAADQLTEREHADLAKAAGAAANVDGLLAVAAEMRVRTDRVAELVETIRGVAERDDGPSLDDARDALTEKLEALWAADQLALEDFERLAEAVGRAGNAGDLLDVAAQLRARVDRNENALGRLRDALDFDEPWPKPGSEPNRDGPELLDEDALAALLAPGGAFAARPEYEDRSEQRDMLRFVARRFNEGGVGLVEAGTGTGKSLAYLAPAASWALQNRERTIVSTNTINLQQQLVSKDLPLAQLALGKPVKWALFKGRGNYVSIRRARLAAGSAGDLFAGGEGSDLDAVMKWLEKTRDGSKSDLPATPAKEVWNEVKSDPDACFRDECPHYQECFYFRARRNVADADVVVVNHALFFADLNIRVATDNFDRAVVLPRYRRVIFDEAHHLDEVATEALATEVARRGVLALLARLRSARRNAGLLPSAAAALRRLGGPLGAELRRRVLENAVAAVQVARERTDEFFDALRAWTESRADREDRIRLPAARGQEPVGDPRTRTALDNLLAALGAVSRELNGICERMKEEEDLGSDLKGRVLDLRSSADRLATAGAALGRCLLPGEAEDGDRVRWLERTRPRRGRPDVRVGSAPVSVGPILREHLFGRVDAAVLTSATMAVGGRFDHFREWMGLQDGRTSVHEAALASPFDYREQAVLKVCMGAGGASPPAGRAGQWLEMSGPNVARVLHDLAEITGGGVMALFTSHKALRGAAEEFRRLAGARWQVFVHGERPRDALVRDFALARDGILLGTRSFWEGVDVPGPALRALVIHRLPFSPPNDPVTEARKEAIEARGRNAFHDYDVPVAGLRLKQGAGRLIRTRSDRGAVVLLDDRVRTKAYGPDVLAALPPMPVGYGEWASLMGQLREFYADGGKRRSGETDGGRRPDVPPVGPARPPVGRPPSRRSEDPLVRPPVGRSASPLPKGPPVRPPVGRPPPPRPEVPAVRSPRAPRPRRSGVRPSAGRPPPPPRAPPVRSPRPASVPSPRQTPDSRPLRPAKGLVGGPPTSVRPRRRTSKSLVAAGALLAAVAGGVLWQGARSPQASLGERPQGAPGGAGNALRVTFLDVGQGDAVLIQAPGGETALVDAGRGSAVASQLRRLGVHEIDLLVASHADRDHIGGMDDVLKRFPVRYFMDNGLPHTTQDYERLMAAVEAEDA